MCETNSEGLTEREINNRKLVSGKLSFTALHFVYK